MNIDNYEIDLDTIFDGNETPTKTYTIDDMINDADKANPYYAFCHSVTDDELIAVSYHIVTVWRRSNIELIKTYDKNEIDKFKADYKNAIFVGDFDLDYEIQSFHQKYDLIMSSSYVMQQYEEHSSCFEYKNLSIPYNAIKDKDFERLFEFYSSELKFLFQNKNDDDEIVFFEETTPHISCSDDDGEWFKRLSLDCRKCPA